MSKRNLLFLVLLAFPFAASAQISIANPGLEGTPGTCSTAMPGWQTFSGSPDIQPGCFCIKTVPHGGNSFMSIHFGEALGQKMPAAVVSGTPYQFTLWLTNDNNFASAMAAGTCPDKMNGGPGLLEIWLGNALGDKSQMIFTSGRLDPNLGWRKFTCNFTANANYQFFTFFSLGNYSGSGNALVDDISPNILLPQGLLQVQLNKTAEGNNIAWSTASEKDVRFFEVEYIAPNQEVKSLAKVFAKGNSSVAQSYSYVDKINTEGYYRIKVINSNSQLYSNLVAIAAQHGQNPFKITYQEGKVTISKNTGLSSPANIKLFTLSGNEIDINNKLRLTGKVLN